MAFTAVVLLWPALLLLGLWQPGWIDPAGGWGRALAVAVLST